MSASGEHFSLRWNNYSNHIASAFDSLRSQEDFVDVTLCCEGRKIRAHKVLLSACSLYFRDVFKENPCQHPVIVFKNVKYDDLLALIEFMYQGEVSVQQESLPSFLTTAEMLSVQGLTGGTSNSNTKQDQPLNTSASSATTTYVQSLPQLIPATQPHQQQHHHQQPQQQQQQQQLPNKQHHHHQQQQQQTVSKRTPTVVSSMSVGDIKFLDASGTAAPILKTYAVQAVVNKTQVPQPISIPATVKLRSIPASAKHDLNKQQQHTIIQQQQQQQQQHTALIDNAPSKKRRISDVEVLSVTNADIEEAEFIVGESHDQLQQHLQQRQPQQQLQDDVDTNDDEEAEEDETEDASGQYVKMEIPEYMDDNRQQQQQTVVDESMMEEGDLAEEEDEEEDEDEQHLEQHSTAGDHEHDASQADVTEQYGIMEASELELMYQQHQQDQQQQQQQQGTEMETIYVSQSSVEETTQSAATIAVVKPSSGVIDNSPSAQQTQATNAQPSHVSERRSGGAVIDLVCHQCVRKFTSHAALKRHIESKHTQNLISFNCELCSKPFKTKWSLSTHTSRFHRRTNEDGLNASTGSSTVAIVSVTGGGGSAAATTTTQTTTADRSPAAASGAAEDAAKTTTTTTTTVVAARRVKMEVSQ